MRRGILVIWLLLAGVAGPLHSSIPHHVWHAPADSPALIGSTAENRKPTPFDPVLSHPGDVLAFVSATGTDGLGHQKLYVYACDPVGTVYGIVNATDGVIAAEYVGQPDISVGIGYDAANRMNALIVTGGVSAAYAYADNASLVTNLTLTTPGGITFTKSIAWDSARQLPINIAYAVAGTGSNVASLAYTYATNDTRISRMTLADGTWWDYTYDGRGRLASGSRRFADGSIWPGRQFGYAYDMLGNTTQAGPTTEDRTPRYSFAAAGIYNVHSNRNWSSKVDICGSIAPGVSVVVNHQLAQNANNWFYTAVPVANAVGPVDQPVSIYAARTGTVDLVVAVTGRVSVAKANETLSYDGKGSLLSDSRHQYTFNGMSWLTSVTDTSITPNVKLAFDYDADGRRMSKTVSLFIGGAWQVSEVHQFTYDQWNLISEIITANGTQTIRKYTWGLDLAGQRSGQPGQSSGGIGGLLAITETSNSTTRIYYPICDHHGSILQLLDAQTGASVAQYDYDPFGELLSVDGPAAAACPFGFQTRYRDSETGLIYFNHRYYDPRTATFLSRDPKGEAGGANLTAAFAGDPINNIDPDGCDAVSISQPGGGYLSYSGNDYVNAWNLSGYRAPTPLPMPRIIPQITAGGPRPMLVPAAAISVDGGSYLQSQSNGKYYGSLYEARQDGCWDSIEAPPENGSLDDWQHYYARTGQWGKAGEVRDTQASLLMLSLVPLPGRAGKVAAVPLERAAVAGLERRLERLGYDQVNASIILQSVKNGEQVVVVGENMRRVRAVANMVDEAGGRSVIYNPRNWTGLSRNALEADRSWLRYWVKEKGVSAIDLGRQPTPRPTGPSPFYGVENRSLTLWDIYTPFAE